jgi:hypothetical protein
MKWSAWFCAACALGAGAYGLGQYLGRVAAEDVRARLEPIWPGMMAMHERDRAALAGSALYCKLNVLPTATPRVDVFSCLRRGAAQIMERDPASDLPSRLEELIRDADTSNVAPGPRMNAMATER